MAAKKQIENIQSAEAYVRPKTEKERILDELGKKGYRADDAGGVPIFVVQKQEDIDFVTNAFRGICSFGFRYPSDAKIKC